MWTTPRNTSGPFAGLDRLMQNFLRQGFQPTANTNEGDLLVVASDYGGQHKGALYDSYSFIIADHLATNRWFAQISEARQSAQFFRRISFKGLGDDDQMRFLPTFLKVADGIRGTTVTILVSKKFRSLFSKNQPLETAGIKLGAYSQSSTATIERLFRVLHCLAFLVAGTIRPGQDVHWITDNDEIIANESMVEDFYRLSLDVLNAYLPHKCGVFNFLTPGTEGTNLLLEDLLAIPDLVAGAVTHTVSEYDFPDQGPPSMVLLPFPSTTAQKARRITEWLDSPEGQLKRQVFGVDLVKNGRKHLYRTRPIVFKSL